ncbi:AAA family ATPase [Candidatus Curtissbacteria bacterium]|nr:AAA family ATPase [Candidatus Curtissbacteria bacterium]
MPKIVIGLVGPIASGKGVIAKYLKELGFSHQSLSDRLREEFARRGASSERFSLQDLGNELRQIHGNAVLAELSIAKLKGDEEYVVIDSIRNPGEIEYLRSSLDIFIIGVDAKDEDRLVWYLERAKKRGEDTAKPESFWAANQRDLGEENDSGQQVSRCLVMADTVLINRPGAEAMLIKATGELIKERFGVDPEGLRRSCLERV